MKTRITLFVFVLIFAVFLAGCKTTVDVTDAPVASNHLERIMAAGKVTVGTSADYPPYEFVDETGKMTGFDIELMTEIAKRMGVELEWTDMPFDSLIAAVQENKIDLSISCFNYDEERDLQVDFTDAYYTSEDAFLAGSGFMGTFEKPEDAANFKVGVQSGTVQDDWLTGTLVETGLMDEANLFRYPRVDQAALDLQAGRIDLLMADYVPAKAVAAQYGDFQILYNGVLATGPINIVLPNGDVELQAKLNAIIKELQDEGFIDTLAVKYFSE